MEISHFWGSLGNGSPRWGPPARKDGCIGGTYSLFLWILPLMVLGSSSRNSTIRGYL